MAKTFTKGRTLTILLAISILANCAMAYYLNLALFDLNCAREIDRLHVEEIKKLNKQIEERPTKFDLSTAKPETKKRKYSFPANLQFPEVQKSYYIPPYPQPNYTNNSEYNNSFMDGVREMHKAQNREREERRIMRLESKINNLEMEQDYEFITGRRLGY